MAITKKVTPAKKVTPVAQSLSVAPVQFEWGIVVAGTVVALAITIVLMQFGSIVGLSTDSPLRGEGSLASWGAITTGLWILWVQLLASLSGGYLVGRMRLPNTGATAHEVELRDGFYGLIVWGLSTLAVFVGVSLVAAVSSALTIASDEVEATLALTRIEQNTTIIFAFIAGATSLVAGAVSWWAATVGGDHRDSGLDLSAIYTFK